MRPINEIIIHCTDTRPNWWADKSPQEKVAEIRRWHVQDRGWSDIGYHFVIDRDGTVVVGRPVEKSGAHTKGHNADSIGISLMGGHGSASSDAFDDHFTIDQDEALRKLIDRLRSQYPSITKISGHNQYAPKACPGFSVPNWIVGDGKANIKPMVASKERTHVAKSTTVQATVVQAASAAGAGVTALSALDGTAQLVLIGCLALVVISALWIFKERIRRWNMGDR